MEALKSYTNLEQSKKLAEILPIESADMYWWYNGQKYYVETIEHDDFHKGDIPAWSLSALLSVLPKEVRLVGSTKDHYWYCECIDAHDSNWYAGFESSDNPVDACYEMIVKLHEQKLLLLC